MERAVSIWLSLYPGLALGTYCWAGLGKPQKTEAWNGQAMPWSQAGFQLGFPWGSPNHKVANPLLNPPMKGIVSFLPASSSPVSCYEECSPAQPYNLM